MRDNLRKPAKIVIASCLTATMVAGGIFVGARSLDTNVASADNWTETYGDVNSLVASDMNQAITRSEFATLIANSVEMHVTSIDYDSIFTDIKGHWAERNILICRELGIIQENEYPDAKFNPDQLISSDDMIKMLERSLNIGALTTMNADGTYSSSGGAASSVIEGNNVYINSGNNYYILFENFVPNSEITREEILDILGNKDEIKEQLDEEKPTTGTTTGTGGTSSNNGNSSSNNGNSSSSGSSSSGSNSGSSSSGSSTNVNFTFNYELDSTAYSNEEIEIETLGSNFTDVTWTVKKNGIDVKFSDVIKGNLTKTGGKITIADEGSYTLIGTAKNSAGKTIVVERTVTIYSKLTADFLIPTTTTVGNTFSFTFRKEGDLAYDVAWALKKNGEFVNFDKYATNKLNNTGGSICFNEIGNFTVVAVATDNLGKQHIIERDIAVSKALTIDIELPEIAYVNDEVELVAEVFTNEMATIHWTLTKDDVNVNLASYISGEITNDISKLKFTQSGSYVLTAKIIDENGNTATSSTKINVYALGSAGFYVPYNLTEDEVTDVTTNFNIQDIKSVTWSLLKDNKRVDLYDYVDGRLTDKGGEISFNEVGNYTLKVTIVGSLDKEYSFEQRVVVKEVAAPTISFNQPSSAYIGEEFKIETKTSNFTNCKIDWLIAINNGYQSLSSYVDGTMNITGGTISFKYDGIYNIVAKVTDSKGQIHYFNADNPTKVVDKMNVSLTAPKSAIVGEEILLETNTNSTVTWSIKRNGSTVSTSSVINGSLSNSGGKISFTKDGEYEVTVSIVDSLGKTYSDSQTIDVTSVAPTLTLEAKPTRQVKDGKFYVELIAIASDKTATIEFSGQSSGGYYDVGTHTVKARAKLTDSVYSEWESVTFEVVNTAPTVRLKYEITDKTRNDKTYVEITPVVKDAEEDEVTLEWDNFKENGYYEVGTHTVRVQATDSAGAKSSWKDITFEILAEDSNVEDESTEIE